MPELSPTPGLYHPNPTQKLHLYLGIHGTHSICLTYPLLSSSLRIRSRPPLSPLGLNDMVPWTVRLDIYINEDEFNGFDDDVAVTGSHDGRQWGLE